MLGYCPLTKLTTGIYAIYNTITKRVYVGSSRDIYTRINYHRIDLLWERHHNYRLQNDYNLYGEKSFSVYLLESFKGVASEGKRKPNDELYKLEQDWINLFYKRFGDKLYNLNLVSFTPDFESYCEDMNYDLTKGLP